MLGLYFGGGGFTTTFGNDEVGNIELDATLAEDHSWSAEATQNPVEDGAPVSDFVIEKPDKLTLRGFMTETPLIASSNVRDYMESLTQNAFDLLRDLIKERIEVTVYTQYFIYDSMILTDLSIPRSSDTGEALEFTAEFVSIRKVETQLVEVPPGISAKKEAKAGGKDGSVAKKAEPQKDGGKKQANEITKTKPERTSQLGNVFGGG